MKTSFISPALHAFGAALSRVFYLITACRGISRCLGLCRIEGVGFLFVFVGGAISFLVLAISAACILFSGASEGLRSVAQCCFLASLALYTCCGFMHESLRREFSASL